VPNIHSPRGQRKNDLRGQGSPRERGEKREMVEPGVRGGNPSLEERGEKKNGERTHLKRSKGHGTRKSIQLRGKDRKTINRSEIWPPAKRQKRVKKKKNRINPPFGKNQSGVSLNQKTHRGVLPMVKGGGGEKTLTCEHQSSEKKGGKKMPGPVITQTSNWGGKKSGTLAGNSQKGPPPKDYLEKKQRARDGKGKLGRTSNTMDKPVGVGGGPRGKVARGT